MRIINEPTAAAIAYGLLLNETNSQRECGGSLKTVLVFDLGGGTFDVSLLHIQGSRMEVKATAGDTYLGGEDFDNRMVNHFIEEFERKHKSIKMDFSLYPRTLRRLKSACERAKRVLSFATETTVEVEYFHSGLDLNSKISRAKFEELNLELFSKCMDVLRRCLEDAKMDVEDVSDIVLVGGSTRIPRVQKMLQEFFQGKGLCKSINPDEAVAYGAAVQAAKLIGRGGKKAQDLVLVDVVPLSLGLGGYSGVMTVVIPRNTPIPVKKSSSRVTVFDNQSKVTFRIYEGERDMSKDNNFLGKFTVNGLPPEPAETSPFVLTFVIDNDGVLTVTAEQKKHHLRGQTTITNETGRLNADEIERLIREAEVHKANDRERMQKAVSRSRLEVLLCNLKFRITQVNAEATITAADKERMNNEIVRVSSWLQENKEAEPMEFDVMAEELESIWLSISDKN